MFFSVKCLSASFQSGLLIDLETFSFRVTPLQNKMTNGRHTTKIPQTVSSQDGVVLDRSMGQKELECVVSIGRALEAIIIITQSFLNFCPDQDRSELKKNATKLSTQLQHVINWPLSGCYLHNVVADHNESCQW